MHLKDFKHLPLVLQVANSGKEVKAHTFLASTKQFSLTRSVHNHIHNLFDGVKHKLEDKMLPETLISIKISKKHINTIEQKDRIVKESLENLLEYLSGASTMIAFPEIVVPIDHILRKFRKASTNNTHRSIVQEFLQKLDENREFVLKHRDQLKANFNEQINQKFMKSLIQANGGKGKDLVTPLQKER